MGEWKPLVYQAGSFCPLSVAAIVYNVFERALSTSAVAISPSAQAVRMRFVARAQAVCTAASMVCMTARSVGRRAMIVSLVNEMLTHSHLRHEWLILSQYI